MNRIWLSWPRPPLDAARTEPGVAQAAWHRLSYSGASSRTIWEPRLARIAEASLTTELELVASGRIDAALVWCAYAALPGLVAQLAKAGLAWKAGPAALSRMPPETLDAGDPLTRMTYALVVARSAAEAARLASDAPASVEAAIAFGYPRCCAEARVRDMGDPLAVLLREPGRAEGPLATGAMLGALGLGPLRHLPCSPDCTASHDAAQAFLATMASLGHDREARWLADMGGWRCRASVASGVAEVTTGALRFVYQSDAAAAGSIASGADAPEGAPTGLAAIFHAPVRPDRSSTARRDAASPDIGDGFAEAGFATPFAQRSRWSCVVWEQAQVLRKAKTAIHLGCGSGSLLELLVQTRPSLRVCGLDTDAAAARARLEGENAMVADADWRVEARGWDSGGERYDLVFVDPEPLADLPGAAADAIVAGVLRLGRSVVLLASDRALGRFGSLDAMAAKLGFVLETGRDQRISGAVKAWQPAAAMAQ